MDLVAALCICFQKVKLMKVNIMFVFEVELLEVEETGG